MRHSKLLLFALLVLGLGTAAAQNNGHGGCVLMSASNGATMTLQGKVFQSAHDMTLVVPGCEAVVLAYAGDEDTGTQASQLQKDKLLERFRRYTSETYKGTGKNLCIQCAKYEVAATLTGRLDVATIPEGATKDPMGFARDASGKVVGKVGWGHPVPIYRYRLVIESVSEVDARKLPKPSATDSGSTVLHESGHVEGAR